MLLFCILLPSLPLSLSPSLPPCLQGNLSTDSIVIEGTVSNARLGMAVLGVGDIDRDGFGGELHVSPNNPPVEGTLIQAAHAMRNVYCMRVLLNKGKRPVCADTLILVRGVFAWIRLNL